MLIDYSSNVRRTDGRKHVLIVMRGYLHWRRLLGGHSDEVGVGAGCNDVGWDCWRLREAGRYWILKWLGSRITSSIIEQRMDSIQHSLIQGKRLQPLFAMAICIIPNRITRHRIEDNANYPTLQYRLTTKRCKRSRKFLKRRFVLVLGSKVNTRSFSLIFPHSFRRVKIVCLVLLTCSISYVALSIYSRTVGTRNIILVRLFLSHSSYWFFFYLP